MSYPCSCGRNATSDGRKYLKTAKAVKRRYRCLCGAVIHTLELLAPAGKQGRPRAQREPVYQG